ncbi:MAG: hypothetical protein J5789_05330 [Oscillospiraceae bacterium]|nr:hypothetical protein [Oscillospiraceae bacterium]
MNLEELYHQVREAVAALDFESIWPGFTPLRFALYDAERCYFDGQYIEKTDAFCANTSIEYQGEQIAIWMVQEELEIPVLTSKIVHEMFHGFQRLRGWDCWPNEMEALSRYGYQPENLWRKLRENELLLKLLEGPDESALAALLASRKCRSEKFPFEFSYESQVEEIEGTANYVEWQVLKQLDGEKARALTERMGGQITRPEALLPIRISCYFTGALMINALAEAGRYFFTSPERPAIRALLRQTLPAEAEALCRDARFRAVSEAVAAFHRETDEIVRSALERNDVAAEGSLELLGVNVYNARCHNGYITSTYFVMFREGGADRFLQGNFVLRMQDEKTVAAIYRWA